MSRNISLKSNKRYVEYDLVSGPEIFRDRYYQGYAISHEMLISLSKSLGFSYDLYSTIDSFSKEAADSFVKSMSENSKHESIVLLLDEENRSVVNYSLESPRTPVLNNEFFTRVLSLLDTTDEVTLSEYYYHPDSTESSMIIRKKSPVVVEEKYMNKDSNLVEYGIGVLLVNDELNSTYCRLVLYVEGHPIYLPASYYSPTTSRYKRSTSSSVEALEVLVLKVLEDLRDDYLLEKIKEVHYKYRVNKSIITSYEEYNTLLRYMRRVPSIIEDNSILAPLLERYEKFERKYGDVDSQKSSYIWRCTATSDITIGSLVSLSLDILHDLGAPISEYFNIRELLGSYISTTRIAVEIAKDPIE